MFDSVKSCNNSKLLQVFSYTQLMRPQALNKPLLNQQIGGGKECSHQGLEQRWHTRMCNL